MRRNYKLEKLQNGETFITSEKGNSMVPLIKSGQKHKLAPATWEEVEVGDIVYCKVRGNFYTHLVAAKNNKKGCQISNNKGNVNGWTKSVFGVVTEVVGGKHKRKKRKENNKIQKLDNLKEIAQEIRDAIDNKQKEMSLSFVEDTHTYYIMDSDGNITSDLPSVSTVLKAFYHTFDSAGTRSFQQCEGDREKERQLLTEWKQKGDYATNMGSRVHYILEQELVNQYGAYKEVRKPIFDCDDEQIATGDAMIKAGKDFIDLMHERGAVLLDTEMVLGNFEIGITGQPDKVWLMIDKDGNIGLVVTDYKTNQPKNFEVQPWTKIMLPPFEHLWDTALGHYYVQIPLYAKLLLKMLEGTKYEGIPFFGGVVLLLKKDGTFEEHRIPKKVIDIVMNMDVGSVLKEREAHIKEHKRLEKRDSDIVNS